MKERPILFSTPMVKAVLAGTKTQTRRVITLKEFQQSTTRGYDWEFRDRKARWHSIDTALLFELCPYGKVGDRLWVRETFFQYGMWEQQGLTKTGKSKMVFIPQIDDWCDYMDNPPLKVCTKKDEVGNFKRPSIHMQKKLSRITLEIVNVRVERVQDISGMDSINEGIDLSDIDNYQSYVKCFEELWDSINAGSGYGWKVNPWVWVLEFKVIS